MLMRIINCVGTSGKNGVVVHKEKRWILGHLIELLVHWRFKRPVSFWTHHWTVTRTVQCQVCNATGSLYRNTPV